MAIDKDFLQFEKVEYIEVIKVSDDSFTYKILDVAFKVVGEEIQWKNLRVNWIVDPSDDLYLVEEGNEVFAYDFKGELIPSIPSNA